MPFFFYPPSNATDIFFSLMFFSLSSFLINYWSAIGWSELGAKRNLSARWRELLKKLSLNLSSKHRDRPVPIKFPLVRTEKPKSAANELWFWKPDWKIKSAWVVVWLHGCLTSGGCGFNSGSFLFTGECHSNLFSVSEPKGELNRALGVLPWSSEASLECVATWNEFGDSI